MALSFTRKTVVTTKLLRKKLWELHSTREVAFGNLRGLTTSVDASSKQTTPITTAALEVRVALAALAVEAKAIITVIRTVHLALVDQVDRLAELTLGRVELAGLAELAATAAHTAIAVVAVRQALQATLAATETTATAAVVLAGRLALVAVQPVSIFAASPMSH